MPLFDLADGSQVLVEFITDLLCSGCREPIDIHTLRKGGAESANFMFDLSQRGYDALAHGEYFYLHKRCAKLERILRHRGAQFHWGWHHMSWVLGIDKTWNKHFGNLAQSLYQRMPQGAYEHLYNQWRPAIRDHKLGFTFKRQVVKVPKSPKTPLEKSYVVLPGYVYIIDALGSGRVKIGRSFSPIARLQGLDTASPFDLKVLRQIKTEDCVGLERNLKTRYKRYNVRKEWFALPPDVLAALLQEDFA